jgi:uncharacterized damage-inducible protein DinB
MHDQTASLLHQVELAYERRSWHGPNLRGALRGVTLDAACYRPQPERHNIWEVLVHCAYWKYRMCRLLTPGAHPSFPLKGSDWFPRPGEQTDVAWRADLRLLEQWHENLKTAVAALDPVRLAARPEKSEFTLFELVSGAIAHDFYHAGQIRLLRRMFEQDRSGADG